MLIDDIFFSYIFSPFHLPIPASMYMMIIFDTSSVKKVKHMDLEH